MRNGKITFRLEADEMRELVAEAKKGGKSPHEVAREWMRAYGRLRESTEALAKEFAELRREAGRGRVDLANVCKVLLCRVGKVPEEVADRWVRENLLK